MYAFADRFEGVTGSEIRKIFTLLADPEMISFAGGNPAPDLFPSKELAEISAALIAGKGDTVLQYGNTKGIPELLNLIRELDAGIIKEYDDIIILSGSSQGIDCFSRALLNDGDPILVEAPTFIGALQTFKLAGADIIEIPLEADGVEISVLEEEIIKRRPKFFYTIPTFQNPSGVTMSDNKRRFVYELCKLHNVLILEDDPYFELRYDEKPLPSVKSRDDCGIVCRLSSFSKTVSPGLRVGYAIAHKDITAKFNLIKQGQDVHTSNLSQYIIYEYIKQGYYTPHIDELRKAYRVKRDAMLDSIESYFPDDVQWTHPDGGLFIWITMGEDISSRKLFDICVKEKVAFVPGEPFFAHAGSINTLRLNFSMPSIAQISQGIKRMGKIMRKMKDDILKEKYER